MKTARWIRRLVGWLTPIGLAGLLFAGLIWHYGSVGAMAAVLRGAPLYVEFPGDVGTLKAGTSKEFAIVVQNMSTNTVRLLGIRATCSCLSATSLPAELAPGGRYSIPLKLDVRGNRRSQHGITVNTDIAGRREFSGMIAYVPEP